MALFAKQFSLLLLFASLLSSNARENQFFNKASDTTTTNDFVPYSKQPVASPQPEASPKQKQPEASQKQEQPEFLPDNSNGHGLYGRESGRQLPPSSAAYKTEPSYQPINKHLPKNYNPVAYVTEPDDINDRPATFTDDNKSFATNKNNFYGGGQNYYTTLEEKEPEYYRGGSSFNSGGGANGYEPQGMSDTRWVEDGKYHYDVEADKFNSNHPYERLKRPGLRTEYGNGENGYGIDGGDNSMGEYQKPQYEFEDEENRNWRP